MPLYLCYHHIRKKRQHYIFYSYKMQQFLLFYQKTDTKFNWIHIVQTSISNYYNNIIYVESLFKAAVTNRRLKGTNQQKQSHVLPVVSFHVGSKHEME